MADALRDELHEVIKALDRLLGIVKTRAPDGEKAVANAKDLSTTVQAELSGLSHSRGMLSAATTLEIQERSIRIQRLQEAQQLRVAGN